MGWSVSIFEASDDVGGKAGSMTLDGYRFDTGPSLLTMPEVFDELFIEAGARLEDYLRFIRLEEICRYFYSDGTRISAWSDESRFAVGLQAATGESPWNLHRFLDYSERIYRTAGDLFLRRSLRERSTYRSATFWRSLVRFPAIDPIRTMARAVEARFDTPHARQLFERYATYNGSNPFRAPATFNLIPYVEYRRGAWAIEGGTYAISKALEALARRIGVHVHTGTPVGAITYETARRGRRRVTGIRVDGRHVASDIVICNVDISTAYPQLLDEENAPELVRYRKLEPSSSALVFFWGVRGINRLLSSHNILFSDDYRREFAAIFDEHRVSDDPTVYINITSRTTPSDAPADSENWFILVNAPVDSGQDWVTEAQRTRAAVIRKVNERLGIDIEPHIAVERTMTPADIAANTGSYRGALYGIASNSRTAAFLRHPNRSRRYRGLYFCGGSTHPGGGMPLVVLSGKIVSDLVLHRES